MEIGKYLHTIILGWRSWKPLSTPPGMGYIKRAGIVECQSGSNHSHSMVSVMFLLLNLLFCFCMHLFRLGYLTVCLIDMLCWFIALNLIWLYNCWHKYVRLPLCDNSKKRKSTDPSCHVSLTLALALSPSLSLSFASLKDSDHGMAGLSLPDRNLSDPVLLFSLASLKDSDPVMAGHSLPDRSLSHPVPLLSLVSLKDSDPGMAGLSLPDRNLSDPIPLLSLASLKDSDPGMPGLSLQDKNPSDPIPLLSLASLKDSDPGMAGLFLPDRNPSDPIPLLSLVSLKDSDSGMAGLSLPDRNLSDPLPLLSLSLPNSGKGPCIRHTHKKVQWEVGTRYINPIQPYRFGRRLYPCYQNRLCVIQLGYEIVVVVNLFPCWGPVWYRGWDINATLLFFYSTAPRTSCLGSPVTRYQSGTEDARCQSGTEVARYHRPFEARSVNSTRRETFQQLAACDSPSYSGWFAPWNIPPGSPAALSPVTEPLGGVKP